MKNFLLITSILFSFFIQSQEDLSHYEDVFTIDTILHKVKRKETLYSISKIYNISIEEIKKYNSNIQGNKLSKKMELYIPNKKLVRRIKEKSRIQKIAKINLKKIKKNKIELRDSLLKKNQIKFALIAPFKLDEIEIDSIQNTKELLKNLNLTTVSLDFYSGSFTAINELSDIGLEIDLKVFDNENDKIKINQIISENDFNDYDFILGPFIPRNINQFSNATSKIKTPVVSPLTTNKIILNKNVFQTIPSKVLQRDKMLKYIDSLIIKEPDPCVMVIYNEKSSKTKDFLLNRFPYAELINTDETNGFVDPEITDSLLVNSKKNFVFLESENLNTITSVSSLLNSQISNERSIKLMTTYRADIYENENISFEHLGNLNFTYPSYYKPIYDFKMEEFNEKYIKEFGKQPNKIAIRAYDLTMDLILRVAYKRTLLKSINIGETEFLQNKFNYEVDKEGFSNNSIYLIQHEKLNIFELNNPTLKIE